MLCKKKIYFFSKDIFFKDTPFLQLVSELIVSHVNASPGCIYVQSEISYVPRKPEYMEEEARRQSFSANSRFNRIRAGFQFGLRKIDKTLTRRFICF